MRYALVVVAIFISVFSYAQDAKVIELNPTDTRRAEKLYKEMKDAEKSWQDFQDQIKKDYLTVDRNDSEADSSICLYKEPCRYFRTGFKDGNFEFSSDFKFVVPKLPIKSDSVTCDFWHQSTSCITLTPAWNLGSGITTVN